MDRFRNKAKMVTKANTFINQAKVSGQMSSNIKKDNLRSESDIPPEDMS